MDFEVSEEQRAILRAVGTLLERYAGPKRARELSAEGGYDFDLEARLREAGFFDLASGPARPRSPALPAPSPADSSLSFETGPLDAVLVLEAIAEHAGLVAYGAASLVAPALVGERLPQPIALALGDEQSPIRYGAHAKTLLVADEDVVRIRVMGKAEPVRSSFGYPLARVPRDGGDRLGSGTGDKMRALWRVALAAEIAGTMKGALDFTVRYVKERKQFGRAIGSFQAIQHRLAECAVCVEGSRWLAREAAWLGASPEASSLAAAYAAASARRIFHETHQMNGSIGFTREHFLHVWTMRLETLRLEMGGVVRHRRDLASARWRAGVRRSAP